jgi:hypothetical protein
MLRRKTPNSADFPAIFHSDEIEFSRSDEGGFMQQLTVPHVSQGMPDQLNRAHSPTCEFAKRSQVPFCLTASAPNTAKAPHIARRRKTNPTFLAILLFLATPLFAQAAEDPYEHYLQTSRDFQPVAQDPKVLLKAWPTFIYMPWTAKWTIGYDQASGQWSLDHGYNGAFIDREPSPAKLAWINQFKLPFYVDHTASKGYLHLWDGGAVKPHLKELSGTGLRPYPLNDALKLKLQSIIKKNITANLASPYRAAYALDDEISWGHFVHPTMWQITDDPSAYPRWLKEIYGDNPPKRDKWISYADILPHLSTWSIADFDASPLMDQWTFNDATWCNFLGDLVTYANSIDPSTPVGIVGGQEPSAFGGYDYARLMRKIQFIEAYNLGSSQAVIRSFNRRNAIPAVTTHFHRDVDDSIWQAWYYLAHGNRGFIGWVQGWFDGQTPKPFHNQIAPALKEVERLSPLLTGATWQHDGIAIYYSHPSIQLGWILDAQAHRKQWTARNDDQRLGSAPNVRHAWENMLRDADLQYNFLSYVDVVQHGISPEYKVVILPAALCLSDAEAARLRDFVNNGGTLIADYLPGLWDQHGVGRKTGGVLDDVFGIKHDPALKAADLFGGTDKLWVELDQEANFYWKTYESFLTNRNTCIKDESGFDKAVRNTPVAYVNRFGKGTAVMMNLSPQWYNAYRAAGEEPARSHREVFLKHLSIQPTIRLTGQAAFGHEITRWQNDGRTFCFVTLNPEITGNQTGGGNSTSLKSATSHIQLNFATPLRHARNERTGAALSEGASALQFDWKQNEAIMISYDSPDAPTSSAPSPTNPSGQRND